MNGTILGHFLGERPETYDYIFQGISWTLMMGCCFWFSYMWGKSFIRRKFYRSWDTSLIICVVFFLFGMDKFFDVLSIWYPFREINALFEGASSLLFVTWIVNQIRTKTIPVFLPQEKIDEIDINEHEKLHHSIRITNMLDSKNNEEYTNED